jgi:hypothetical protein
VLQPCGTEAAYRRHLKYGEEPCEPCREAFLRAAQARSERHRRKRGSKVRGLQPCGTAAAYQRHKLHGEEPCEACKQALRESRRASYQPSSREIQSCGTHSAYVRHRKLGEEPCEACRAAEAEYGRRWREANQARKQKYDRQWKAENPDRVIQSVRRRMALKLAVPSEPYTTAEIAARDGYRCGLCRRAVDMKKKWPDPKSPSIDHIVPFALGGDDTRANVQLAHFGCNAGKQARFSGQVALFG